MEAVSSDNQQQQLMQSIEKLELLYPRAVTHRYNFLQRMLRARVKRLQKKTAKLSSGLGETNALIMLYSLERIDGAKLALREGHLHKADILLTSASQFLRTLD